MEKGVIGLSNTFNLSLGNLPPELISKIDFLFTIAKAIGILFIIYIIFLIIKSMLNIIEKKRIKHIYKKVDEINEKLDLLLKKRKKKSK